MVKNLLGSGNNSTEVVINLSLRELKASCSKEVY